MLRTACDAAEARLVWQPHLSGLGMTPRRVTRYRRIRAEKKKQFAKEWERFWEDVRCDHVAVWEILTRVSGRIATFSCMAPAEEQRRNYADLGQIQRHADFNEDRAMEAEEWVTQFIQDGRGTGPPPPCTRPPWPWRSPRTPGSPSPSSARPSSSARRTTM